MIDSRADVSRRSEENAGSRRLRDACWCWNFRYASSSGASLNTIIESASFSASQWEECRLESTRVLSSGTVSVSNVGSPSEQELSSVLVLELVGEGNAAWVPNGSWL
jgi:hypothetical protein